MKRTLIGLLLIFVAGTAQAGLRSSSDCSICKTRRESFSFDPGAPTYLIAVCIPDDNGTISDCQVVDVDQFTQQCASVVTVSYGACNTYAQPPGFTPCFWPCIQMVNTQPTLLLRFVRQRHI